MSAPWAISSWAICVLPSITAISRADFPNEFRRFIKSASSVVACDSSLATEAMAPASPHVAKFSKSTAILNCAVVLIMATRIVAPLLRSAGEKNSYDGKTVNLININMIVSV